MKKCKDNMKNIYLLGSIFENVNRKELFKL